MAMRTITLTGRPPVKVDEDQWPLIASCSDSEYDNQYEFQANRKSTWHLNVRRHEDGRAIVYAIYKYTTQFQSERDYTAKRGVLLPVGENDQAICDAIREVAEDIARAEHYGDDANRWPTLADNCIADMPAEHI